MSAIGSGSSGINPYQGLQQKTPSQKVQGPVVEATKAPVETKTISKAQYEAMGSQLKNTKSSLDRCLAKLDPSINISKLTNPKELLNLPPEKVTVLLNKVDKLMQIESEIKESPLIKQKITSFLADTPAKVKGSDKEISDSTKKIGENNTKITNLTAKKSDATTKLATANSELKILANPTGQEYKAKFANCKPEAISNYKKELEKTVSSLESSISQLDNDISSIQTNSGKLENNIENIKQFKTLAPAIHEVIKDINALKNDQCVRSTFPIKLEQILNKASTSLSSGLFEQLKGAIDEHLHNISDTDNGDIKGEPRVPVAGSDAPTIERFKEQLMNSLVELLPEPKAPTAINTNDITITELPKAPEGQKPQPIIPKPTPDPTPKPNLDNVIKPIITPKIKCDDFMVKDRPAFDGKLTEMKTKANTDGSLIITPKQFRELRDHFDSSIFSSDTTFKSKDQAHTLLKGLLQEVTGKSESEISKAFDDRGVGFRPARQGIVLTSNQVEKITTALKEHSYSDLGALTKLAMDKMGVSELTNFDAGSTKSKKIEIGASVGASISVSDVLKAIPLPGLGDALAAVMSKIADAKVSGSLTIDGGVGMTANKNANGTIDLNLDFTVKVGAHGKAEVVGKAVTNQSKELDGTQAIQHRVTYSFKNEGEVKAFLDGGKFKEVQNNLPLETKQFAISSDTSRIGSTKSSSEKEVTLSGINLNEDTGKADKVSRKFTEKEVKTVALFGVNSPSQEAVRNTVKIRDDDKLLSKMEVISVKTATSKTPSTLSLNVSFDTLKTANDKNAIPELAERFATDLVQSMKSDPSINFTDAKAIFQAKFTELAGSLDKVEGHLDHKAQNKVGETDLKIIKVSTKSTDLVGFQIPFKTENGKFKLDGGSAEFTLRERKSLGGSIGVGDFFRIGGKGTSASDKIIGNITKVNAMAQKAGDKGTSIVDKLQSGASAVGKVLDGLESAEKILEKPVAQRFASFVGAEGLRKSASSTLNTVNKGIEDVSISGPEISEKNPVKGQNK